MTEEDYGDEPTGEDEDGTIDTGIEDMEDEDEQEEKDIKSDSPIIVEVDARIEHEGELPEDYTGFGDREFCKTNQWGYSCSVKYKPSVSGYGGCGCREPNEGICYENVRSWARSQRDSIRNQYPNRKVTLILKINGNKTELENKPLTAFFG